MSDSILLAASAPALAGIGLLAGVVAALLGIGGGLLITPFLNIVGVPLVVAVPTSMTTIAATSLCTTLRNRKWKNLDLRLGLITAALMIPAVELSTWITRTLGGWDQARVDSWLRLGFIAVLVISMWSVLKPPRERQAERCGPRPLVRLTDGREVSLWYLIMGAIAAGIIGSLLGIGGGRILVPLFVGALAVDLKIALGTSSLVIFISSCYAAFSFMGKGMVDYAAVGWLCSGSLIGSLIGSSALRLCSGGQLRGAYAMLSIAAIAALICKQVGYDKVAFATLLISCLLITIGSLALAWHRSRIAPASNSEISP